MNKLTGTLTFKKFFCVKKASATISYRRPLRRNYLDKHPYHKYDEEEMNAARSLLAAEMEVVKEGMGHGDLSLEAYTQVPTDYFCIELDMHCTHNVPLHFNLVQKVVSVMQHA